jgi:hypothetical protein
MCPSDTVPRSTLGRSSEPTDLGSLSPTIKPTCATGNPRNLVVIFFVLIFVIVIQESDIIAVDRLVIIHVVVGQLLLGQVASTEVNGRFANHLKSDLFAFLEYEVKLLLFRLMRTVVMKVVSWIHGQVAFKPRFELCR